MSLILGLASICVLSKLAAVVYAQVCGPSTFISWAAAKTRDEQGLIHVTVNYNGGAEGAPNATMLRLMQEAVAEWNTYKCSTGVQFDTVVSGSATLEFVYTTDESDSLGCAAYRPGTGRIYHGPNFQTRLTQQDMNHNGVSEPEELHRLRALGLRTLELDYKESNRRDRHGNWFRYRAKVKDARGAQLGRWAWDVFLVTLP